MLGRFEGTDDLADEATPGATGFVVSGGMLPFVAMSMPTTGTLVAMLAARADFRPAPVAVRPTPAAVRPTPVAVRPTPVAVRPTPAAVRSTPADDLDAAVGQLDELTDDPAVGGLVVTLFPSAFRDVAPAPPSARTPAC